MWAQREAQETPRGGWVARWRDGFEEKDCAEWRSGGAGVRGDERGERCEWSRGKLCGAVFLTAQY